MGTQRTIKFRVWDFINKEMDPVVYRCGEQFGHPSSSDWVAMQFTGLKDKEGREIYDGDCPDGIWSENVVKWCDHCHGWAIGIAGIEGHCHQCEGDAMWLDFVADVIEGKVAIIGNIYENPEILEA